MIFRQVEEIKSGRKTQTRRIVKPGDQMWSCGQPISSPETYWSFYGGKPYVEPEIRSDSFARLYKVGQSYAIVPKRGQKAIPDGRIEITGIRRERLQDISEKDAQAEGVADVAAYRALWESINTAPGVRWEDNPLVWVYNFRFVPALVQVELF